PMLEDDYRQFGALSVHYLPVNFFYNFVTLPYFALLGPDANMNFWMGGSLFLMSPFFLLAFPGLRAVWGTHGRVLATSIVVALIPMLLNDATGWVQFGPRYTLDAGVPLLVATAIGASHVREKWLEVFVAIGVAVYLSGTVLLGLL